MLARILADPELQQAAIRFAATEWSRQAVLDARRLKAVRTAGGNPSKPAAEIKRMPVGLNQIGLNEAAKRNILDYPLSGGKRLGDATSGDLDEMIGYHRSFATANAKKANWLSEIRKRLHGTRTVGDVLSAQQVQQLYERAGLK